MAEYLLELQDDNAFKIVSLKNRRVKTTIELSNCHVRLLPVKTSSELEPSTEQQASAQLSQNYFPIKVIQAGGIYRVLFFESEQLRQRVLKIVLSV